MAQFNLAEYETVAERLKRALKDHPDLRIVTHNQTQQHDRAISTWVVYTEVFLNAEDQKNGLPKATGLAFEIDGVGMANKTSALENAETSRSKEGRHEKQQESSQESRRRKQSEEAGSREEARQASRQTRESQSPGKETSESSRARAS